MSETVEAPTFRRWLEEAMRARKLGTRQLEAYTGVSRSTISQLLNGRNLPSNETVLRLARYFGGDAERLLALVIHEKAQVVRGRAELLDAQGGSRVDVTDPAHQIALGLDLLERRDEITPEERQSIELVIRSILDGSRKRREREDGQG